jgi:beta-aspartyl-peptidase (threonine type)
MPSALVVHGGAWDIPDREVGVHHRGVLDALDAGWEILGKGGAAMDAAVAAVKSMEDDPTFDAGVGSFLNADGKVQLDAGLMDGNELTAGSVAAVSRVRNPIELAHQVLQSPYILLVGSGAERFAEENEIAMCDPEIFVTEREAIRWSKIKGEVKAITPDTAFRRFGATPSDTVGAVAVDDEGNIAAATSTGGTPNKHPGRVGDSPIIGAGFYADVHTGACSTTGWGEAIAKVGLARTAVDLTGRGLAPRVAAMGAVMHMHQRVGGLGGCIVVDPAGRVGVAFNTPRMAYAWRLADGRERIEVAQREEQRSVFDAGIDEIEGL